MHKVLSRDRKKFPAWGNVKKIYAWREKDPGISGIRNEFSDGKLNQKSFFHSACCLAGRYDNPIPTRFLAPIGFSKIASLYSYSINVVSKPSSVGEAKANAGSYQK